MRRFTSASAHRFLAVSLSLLVVGLLVEHTIGALLAVAGLVGVLLFVYVGGFVVRDPD